MAYGGAIVSAGGVACVNRQKISAWPKIKHHSISAPLRRRQHGLAAAASPRYIYLAKANVYPPYRHLHRMCRSVNQQLETAAKAAAARRRAIIWRSGAQTRHCSTRKRSRSALRSMAVARIMAPGHGGGPR